MDILYEDDASADPFLLALANSSTIPRLPSLASDPGSSSSNYDPMDAEMDLEDDSQSSTEAPPRAPPNADSIAIFERTLLNASCPSCRAGEGSIKGDEKAGASCETCGWGVGLEVLRPLEVAFAGHHG